MIAIIDYGAGNLGSVYKAFRYIGSNVRVTSDPKDVEAADSLVLPGVGAFAHCMRGLAGIHMVEATRRFIESGRPFLGICVGLQMLFDSSEEMGDTPGLGILPGRVVRFQSDDGRSTVDDGAHCTTNSGEVIASAQLDRPSSIVHRLKVPHIGWNTLDFRPDSVLFRGLTPGDRTYFVHSYFPAPEDHGIVTATTDYGGSFCCAIERGNVHATQFHPEKSGTVGLQILRNFASLAS